MKERILSLLLALVMIVGMVPKNTFHVHAAGIESESVVEETTPPTTEATVTPCFNVSMINVDISSLLSVITTKYLQVLRLSITASTINAFANKPSKENRPV